MFGTIRRHQTWLWGIIITLTVISFVWYFNPSSRSGGGGGGGGSANYGHIYDTPVSREDYANALREVELQYFFRSGGRWPDEEAKRNGFDPDREAYQWMFLSAAQDRMGIQVSSALAARIAREMLAQFGREANIPPEAFVPRILAPRGLTLDDFGRYVRHFLGNQELVSTVGVSGRLITPQEAVTLYTQEHQQLATSALFFSASNYLPRVAVSPEGLSQFYSNRMANYRLPDRVQVSYVEFPLTNFQAEAAAEMAKITNFDEQIESLYHRDGTNFLRQLKASSLADAKVKARDEDIKHFQLIAARKQATDFANKLLDISPQRPENLATLAKSDTNNLAVGLTPPFDREEGPTNLNVGSAFIKAAFSVSPDEPFAGPVPGDDAVYEIAFNKTIPSEIPTLAAIHDQVLADYKFNQAAGLARQSGMAFYQTLTNSLAQKKSFELACSQANLAPTNLPPFSLSTQEVPGFDDQMMMRELKQLAFTTPPGTASEFAPTRDGGLILYVNSRLPVDEAKMNAELPAFLNSMRSQRQNDAFQQWFRHEAQKGLRDTPLNRPSKETAVPSGAGSS